MHSEILDNICALMNRSSDKSFMEFAKKQREQEESIEKYKELYVLAKEAFNEELDRYYRIDEKATRYFAVLTILLGLGGFFGKYILDTMVPPENYYQATFIVSCMGFFLFVLYSYFFLMWSLTRENVYKIPLDESIMSLFQDNTRVTVYYAFTASLNGYMRKNREKTDKKSEKLMSAYRGLLISVLFLIITLITLVVCISKSY